MKRLCGMCSTRSVTVGGRTMTNHNKLLRRSTGCIGLKTGYTHGGGPDAGELRPSGTGQPLVAVTLQDGNDWADHAALYEFGFGPAGGYPVEERLQKWIARCGISSRRAAEELLRQGRVTLNGRVAGLGESGRPGAGYPAGGRKACRLRHRSRCT